RAVAVAESDQAVNGGGGAVLGESDAASRSGLSCDREMPIANPDRAAQADDTSYFEDAGARAGRFSTFSKASGTGVVQVGHEDYPPAPSTAGFGAVALGARKRREHSRAGRGRRAYLAGLLRVRPGRRRQRYPWSRFTIGSLAVAGTYSIGVLRSAAEPFVGVARGIRRERCDQLPSPVNHALDAIAVVARAEILPLEDDL